LAVKKNKTNSKHKYRLPTEIEWEYAAGFYGNGKRTKYSRADDVSKSNSKIFKIKF
jgi:formylglycine-generating enzyme required for sulfatase activity